ncbi:uncharacterized protein LOC103307933 [Acyrthosiphon pisum]|uniref:Uncharacterized protein n=1 Tax=Acyrthosiphon pisum TaxID=7029 RepID=A0A8R1X0E6_ACYPI|nr:uncharacterized protein LOC103307933 [Acyrthosiphon pisum]|eukprot:XP_008178666.1 PREDICTED: uncharacterized protein LOC103307933 [Acyrthosiphon pisum]
MYKYTVMTAAVIVVLASLASSIPATSAQTAANKIDMMPSSATSIHSHHVKPEHHSMFASGGQGVGGSVVLLGAVAAAGAAGIAAVVALVSAILPYFRFFFGGHKGKASDSDMENISEFVLGAFNKYDSQHKA